jgi:hypothetical protein
MNPVLKYCALALLLLSSLALSQPDSGYRDLFETDQFLTAPFQEGESLSYEVNWKPLFAVPAFKAGEVTMSIEKSRLSDKDTYKITAWALSDGALTRVAGFEVKNYFESHIDRLDFRSYRMFQKIRQGKRKRDLELRFDYEKGQTYVDEIDQSISPPRQLRKKTVKGIPSPAADILSVFYVARLRSARPGDKFQLHINEKGDFKKVLVVAEENERLSTPVGNFQTIRFTTTGGLFRKDSEFRIWYSTDQLRIPVRFEADVKIGKVYGDLIRMQTPQQTRSVIQVD